MPSFYTRLFLNIKRGQFATGCAFLLLLALAGCGTRNPYAPVRDVVELPQDAGAYHGLDGDARLLSPETQRAAWERLLAARFDPWERDAPANPAEKVFWGLSSLAGKRLFGENTLPLDPGWLDRMAEASRTDDYPSLHRRAVAVIDTDLRVLPTNRPAFFDFRRAGQGYPFDYMQNSLVAAGTPLLATHVSADRAWVLVECRFAYGWVRATDIAWVDDATAEACRTGTYAAVIRDRVTVTDRDGRYCCTARVGTLLPVAETAADGTMTVLVPVRDHTGTAVLHRAVLPDGAAEPAPLAATPDNFARVANAMMGLPYGWGGLYRDRDCSALTMDLMTAFGIPLPRNSARQAETGDRVSLKGLDRTAKKRAIIERGTPFLTLVRKPGHIMLYVGSRGGEPIVLHAAWGVKTRSRGKFGRKVIGATVVTTLQPGLELSDLAPGGVLLDSVRAITTLP